MQTRKTKECPTTHIVHLQTEKHKERMRGKGQGKPRQGMPVIPLRSRPRGCTTPWYTSTYNRLCEATRCCRKSVYKCGWVRTREVRPSRLWLLRGYLTLYRWRHMRIPLMESARNNTCSHMMESFFSVIIEAKFFCDLHANQKQIQRKEHPVAQNTPCALPPVTNLVKQSKQSKPSRPTTEKSKTKAE